MVDAVSETRIEQDTTMMNKGFKTLVLRSMSMSKMNRILTVVTMIVAMAATSWGHLWTGTAGDGLWFTDGPGGNWNGETAPTGAANIGNGDSVLIDSTTTPETTAMGGGDLDLTGGSTLTIKTDLVVGGDFDFYSGSAHVVIDGGTVTAGDDLKMDNGASTFKMLGGSFENGLSPTESGYFNMTDSASRLEISGGSFTIEDYATISGTLQVIGDSATKILLGSNGDAVTLNRTVEIVPNATGITTIEAVGNVALSGTLLVGLDALTGPSTMTLITAGTITGTFGTVTITKDATPLTLGTIPLAVGEYFLDYAGGSGTDVVLSVNVAGGGTPATVVYGW
jgi:hypothetical protein